MSAAIPTSKRGLALFLVLGVLMGASGFQQGHSGTEQITASDLDLPDAEEMESDSSVLPEVAEDAYLRFVMNMMDGMVAYGMWMYGHGYALGQSVQWLPRVVVTTGTQVLFGGGLLGFAGLQLLGAKRRARDTR